MTIEEFSNIIRDKTGATSTSGRKLPGRDEYMLEWTFENPRYLAGMNVREDMLENVHEVFIDATAEEILKNYQRQTNPQYPDDLPAGASHFDGENTVYYRGDGVQESVFVPEGKALNGIAPVLSYKYNAKYRAILFDHAIPSGELVTITLKNEE